MSNHDIPERPLQPPEDYDVRATAHDVEMEHKRVELEDEYGRIDLKGKVLVCIARQAERIIEEGSSISDDDYNELEGLLDDLKTIEKEGW